MSVPTVAAVGGPDGHTWENIKGQATWENAVREDEDGNLIVEGVASTAEAVRRRRKRLEQTDYSQKNRRVIRDMIRYLYIVLDVSRWSREKDSVLTPGTRLEVTIQILSDFIQEYFDQNPLSHLGLILVRNGEAEILTHLSSSAKSHKVALQSVMGLAASERGPNGGGEFSLQNGLELAGRSLGHQPRHGSREIVVLCSALSTCDPGDILVETLPRLKAAKIRVSTLALSAELNVCRKLAQETSGVMGVALDKGLLRDWLLVGQCVPPPSTASQHDASSFLCDMVSIGFPARVSGDVPTLVHASRETKLFARVGYDCPRCRAKASEIPTSCAVCGLQLVVSPHLARSFHHLFPVPPFSEIPMSSTEEDHHGRRRPSPSPPMSMDGTNVDKKSAGGSFAPVGGDDTNDKQACYGCWKIFTTDEDDEDYNPAATMSKKSKKGKNGNKANATAAAAKESSLRFECPQCKNIFCADCDAYLHETLHNCPGCLCN